MFRYSNRGVGVGAAIILSLGLSVGVLSSSSWPGNGSPPRIANPHTYNHYPPLRWYDTPPLPPPHNVADMITLKDRSPIHNYIVTAKAGDNRYGTDGKMRVAFYRGNTIIFR